MPVSAVIITKNEENRIRRCLDSLKGWVDEIVVVDDCSNDRTAQIAREEYGAHVISNKLNNDFDNQRNLGIEAAKGEWILQMDADEVVPPESIPKIKEALGTNGEYSGFKILRKDCVFDTPLNYRGSCYQMRLLKKGKGRNTGVIHEELEVDGKVGQIEAHILHYNLPSISEALAKQNFYTDLECQLYLEKNPVIEYKFIKKKILFKSVSIFYKNYIKNKAYKDGVYGFIRSCINTLHLIFLWLKVLERAVKEGRLKE